MAASFVTALVIEHNLVTFLDEDLKIGKIMSIPTIGAGVEPAGDYWAVPINDNGIVTGFNYVPTTPTSLVGPTAQSFHVFRLVTTKYGYSESWYVRGTSTFDGNSPAVAGYIQASNDAECCSATPRTLPLTIPVGIAGCQELCQWDSNKQYFGVWGLPTLGAGQTYYAYGYYNNASLTALTATGYTTAAALQTALNANWSSVGTWTVDGTTGIVKVVQTNGSGYNTACIRIVAINPSAP